MYLGLDNGELVAEVPESIVLTMKSFDLSGGVPIVEVGDGATECVEGGSWAIEEGVEPYGEWLRDILG
jgi:hypothetical protein